MTRITLASALIMGLAMTGCGSSESNQASSGDSSGAAKGKGGGGGGGNAMGPSPEILAGMKSDAYRSATFGAKVDANGKPIAAKDDAAKDEKTPKGEAVVLTDDEIKEINKLPDAADRTLALAQKVCLVSEDAAHLGSMGMPHKEVVNGKTIFTCCKSCVSELKKEPDKYLAKLPK